MEKSESRIQNTHAYIYRERERDRDRQRERETGGGRMDERMINKNNSSPEVLDHGEIRI